MREHDERLLALFSKPSPDVHEQARALLNADVPKAKVHTFPDSFEGVARYGKFRQSAVRSEEGAAVAKP